MIVAGERSGDLYGAALASALRARQPGLEIFGCGGDAMREAGVETVADAHRVAMMGITEVLSGLPRAWRTLGRLEQEAVRRRPRLAVLIDFPDFNLRLARRLRRQGVRIVYFVSPQIWAWRKGRINELKALIEKMICIFEFEEEIYRRAGIPVEYVGHPLVDIARPKTSRAEFFSANGLVANEETVAFLPGSRQSEVERNLPLMLDALAILAERQVTQPVYVEAPTLEPGFLQSVAARHYKSPAKLCVVRAAHDAVAYSDLVVAASGTATVEAALYQRPLIVVYRVSRPTAWIARRMVRVPYYSMVNLLAGRELVPELIQKDFTAERLAERMTFLLEHPEAKEEMIRGLGEVKAKLGPCGAIERATDVVLKALDLAGASSRPI
jgi:lipid-A-disaccharide synthase